jgi:hypothetical protein
VAGLTRQAVSSDAASLVYLFFFLIYFLVFYWFYSILKRMEKTLVGIKQLLEGKKITDEG